MICTALTPLFSETISLPGVSNGAPVLLDSAWGDNLIWSNVLINVGSVDIMLQTTPRARDSFDQAVPDSYWKDVRNLGNFAATDTRSGNPLSQSWPILYQWIRVKVTASNPVDAEVLVEMWHNRSSRNA